MNDKPTPIVGPRSYSKKWFAIRSKCIGASEAAACCGMSRWAQPLTVYNNKTGPPEKNDHKGKDEFVIGHLLEDGILNGYHQKQGGVIKKKVPMLINRKRTWMVATPDALWSPDESYYDTSSRLSEWMLGDYIPVDAKTSRHSSEWGDEFTDDIPQEYVFQAQQQMEVTGANECHIPVLLFNSGTIKIYKVKRNQYLIRHIYQAGQEMIDRIENKEPPEPNWTHPGALKLMQDLYDVKEESVEVGVLGRNLWDELCVLRSKKSAIEKRIEGNKARILEIMKDAAAGTMPDGRIIRRKVVNRSEVTIPASSYVRMTCSKLKESNDE